MKKLILFILMLSVTFFVNANYNCVNLASDYETNGKATLTIPPPM